MSSRGSSAARCGDPHVQVQVREVRQRQQSRLQHLAVMLRHREADLLLRAPRQALQQPPPQVVPHLPSTPERVRQSCSRDRLITGCGWPRARPRHPSPLGHGSIIERLVSRRSDPFHLRLSQLLPHVQHAVSVSSTWRTSAGHKCSCNVTSISSLRHRWPAWHVNDSPRVVISCRICTRMMGQCHPRMLQTGGNWTALAACCMHPGVCMHSEAKRMGRERRVPVRVSVSCMDREVMANDSEQLWGSTIPMICIRTSPGSSSRRLRSAASAIVRELLRCSGYVASQSNRRRSDRYVTFGSYMCMSKMSGRRCAFVSRSSPASYLHSDDEAPVVHGRSARQSPPPAHAEPQIPSRSWRSVHCRRYAK